MKKQTKPKLTPDQDSGHQTRILLEEMNKGIKTIGEQHGTIVKRLDNIDSELNSVKMAVMEVDAKVNKLEKRTERIEQKLDTTIS